jgi:hypothetical protein
MLASFDQKFFEKIIARISSASYRTRVSYMARALLAARETVIMLDEVTDRLRPGSPVVCLAHDDMTLSAQAG